MTAAHGFGPMALPGDAGGPGDGLRVTDHFQIREGADAGWEIAQQYHWEKDSIPSPHLRRRARQIAARAILRRAALTIGPSRRSTRPALEPYRVPGRGELEVEETLENIVGLPCPAADDLVMEVRQEKRATGVLMLDTSMSMTGRKLALAGVAAAVLALRLAPKDYAIVLFSSRARTLKRMNSFMPLDKALELMLEVRATGYTNIEAGLKEGYKELLHSQSKAPFGVLVTDGVYTEGNDPLPWAVKYPRLYVLVTEDYKMDEGLCREMARRGHGEAYLVKGYDELPVVMRDLLSRILR